MSKTQQCIRDFGSPASSSQGWGKTPAPGPTGMICPPPCIHLRRSIPLSIQTSFCLKSCTPPLFNSSSSFPTLSQCPLCPSPPPPSSSREQPHRDWANPLSHVLPAPSPGPYSRPPPQDLGVVLEAAKAATSPRTIPEVGWRSRHKRGGNEYDLDRIKPRNKRGTTAGQGIEVYSSVTSRTLRLV